MFQFLYWLHAAIGTVGSAVLLALVVVAAVTPGMSFCCRSLFVVLNFAIVEGGVRRQLCHFGRRMVLDSWFGLDGCRGRRAGLDFLVWWSVFVLTLVA